MKYVTSSISQGNTLGGNSKKKLIFIKIFLFSSSSIYNE